MRDGGHRTTDRVPYKKLGASALRSEVLTAVTVKIGFGMRGSTPVFRVKFEGSIPLRNVGTDLPDNTLSHFIRQ